MMKRLLLTALAAGLFGALAAIPAEAATCYGSGCNGLSSNTTGCSTGAYVVSQTDIYDSFSTNYVGQLTLWWSPTCQAAWSSVLSDFRAFYVKATVTSTSPSNSYNKTANYVYSALSPMVYATSVSYASACGRIEDVGVSGIACSP